MHIVEASVYNNVKYIEIRIKFTKDEAKLKIASVCGSSNSDK